MTETTSDIQDQSQFTAALAAYLVQRDIPVPDNAAVLLADMTAKMMALIMPRSPESYCECHAFDMACYAQIAHDLSRASGADPAAPTYKSVRLGDFSATFAATPASGETALFPGGLSSTARAALRGSGLLYRGVST